MIMNRPFLRCVVIYLTCTSSIVLSWGSTATAAVSKSRSKSKSVECWNDDTNNNSNGDILPNENVMAPLMAAVSKSRSKSKSVECWNDDTNNNSNGDILLNENTMAPLMDRRSAMTTVSSSSIAIAAAAAVWTMLLPLPAPAEATTANDVSSSKIPSWTLEGGVRMPVLALNTAGLSAEGTNIAIALAYRYGITHVDFHPGNERDGVAKYLANSGNRRSELFLTTKIGIAPRGISPSDAAARVRSQITEDLAVLNVQSVDMLMLRDSPDADVIQSQWSVLEEALARGQTRSIGVINFCEFSLQSVLQTAKIKPALNYYLTHVGMGLDPKGLRSYGESRGIRTFAYGAVGEPGPNKELLESPVLNEIAKDHHVSPEAVALRWVLQTGAAVSVRPTIDFGLGTSTCLLEDSNNRCNMGLQERAASFNWELSSNEMEVLNTLTSPSDNPTLFSSAGCPDAFGMKEMIKYLKST